MELKILKMGNLMGTPDAKEILLRAGPGTDAAHARWVDMARIKTAFGYDGQCTSILLLNEECPEGFPALLDPSWVSATGDFSRAVEQALGAIAGAGVDPERVKSILVTHAHPDHFDPRILEHLPNAVAVTHPDAPVSGCRKFDPAQFKGSLEALNTPGHGGSHTSYLLELDRYDLAVCLAGDLIMSQSHYLARHHPLSFTDPEEGLRSIAAVLEALTARKRRYSMLFPGHGLPFFASPGEIPEEP